MRALSIVTKPRPLVARDQSLKIFKVEFPLDDSDQAADWTLFWRQLATVAELDDDEAAAGAVRQSRENVSKARVEEEEKSASRDFGGGEPKSVSEASRAFVVERAA